uniref:FAD synthase n=2 Tax=Babesia bovis TaxID=5865 RepID=A7AW88_BABBO|nr:phosphoadenosine phosphosulfate reductase family domain containing protein [Babesia bovis]|eukprot:XP_001608884.1 phosphoadenosine phosphosulfate reductase family domain containing protein [Babesia bovis T2Bo]
MSQAWEKLERFSRILSAPLQRHVLRDGDSDRLVSLIERSLKLLWQSYSDLGYGNVYVSFNGGKDSVAILHLHRLATLWNPQSKLSASGSPLNVVFFKDPDERLFSDINDFILKTGTKYNFSVSVIEGPWNKGIPRLSSGSKKGYILGCRDSDFAKGSLSEVEEGCVDGIKFHRIHPILHWGYGDVWNFLRLFSLEYCSLYDVGYTSIGGTEDTVANPYLRKPDGTYAPAYTLDDWSLERFGRNKASHKLESST